jgi:hypothetical protein
MAKDAMTKEEALKGFDVETLKALKSIFVDEYEEELKREERQERAKIRAQKQADAERIRQQEEQRIRNKEAVVAACPHKQDNGNDAHWNLHGQRSCDGVIRFTCGICQGRFEPGHPQYDELKRYLKMAFIGNARQEV